MLDCCDRVIAIAKHSYTMIHELYGLPQSKISYIPNGLICKYREYNNEERRSLRKKYHFTDNERIIIFAGRLEQVKGVNRLLAAFKDSKHTIFRLDAHYSQTYLCAITK
jgi:glycosyltransferase involved in cell wall biosynthesis